MSDIAFAHYYQTELAYYRELAQEFASAFPEVAHLVAERGGDPAADRLFQGASLLSARLRSRIEDDIPDIIHPLFDQLWPLFLKPRPATTLLQFTPLPNALQQSQRVPQATRVKSQPVAYTTPEGSKDSISCTFQTCSEIIIHPLELTAAEMNRAQPGDLQLRLRFTITGGALFDNLKIKTLRLHFAGEDVTKYTLYIWLAHYAHQVTLRAPNNSICLRLPRTMIKPVGFRADETLLPSLPGSRLGYQCLQEYFTCPDKFLGIELTGLDQAPPRRLRESFDLVFHLGPILVNNLNLSPHNFRMGCVPAINLSESTKISLSAKPGSYFFKLEAPYQGEVFQLERAGFFTREKGEWVELAELFSQHPTTAEKHTLYYYVFRQIEGVEGFQTYLAICNKKGHPVPPSTEQLQVWLTHTDGHAPARLKPGEVNIPTSSTPSFAKFSNIIPVVPGSSLVSTSNRYWHILAQITMHTSELLTPDGLQLLIREASAGIPGARPAEVLAVKSSMAKIIKKQTIFPLCKIEIILNQSSFASEGEGYLLGRVLSQLWAHHDLQTAFHQVTVTLHPSGSTFTYHDVS